MKQGSRLPPLQTLRAMAAVARTRSFTKAGEELGLTQTAISHQIAQLEAWLGTPLFVRSRKGVELTVLADKAIPDIVAALSALEAVLETRARASGANSSASRRHRNSPASGCSRGSAASASPTQRSTSA
ncbi:LysR family transcriptional regulator [Aminobacter sp. NyZ550]|jgi:DNA-binding transcriptional LysR family regulator|uniref:LysR family transcriptional regulator n=1 Tax=unclassified Aminobacter TaxID=2644704 RepID=UPI0012B0E3C5|nr:MULTISPECIES: LysR family transcriptional regulator [unclassified Aminobacter]MRX36422.1 LysR family transcriptional regulator [Aminobacter sp. MDW-2]QNH36517.1 LysR family transcriptional regulator [Aminobacter sp. MDW-2]WAX97299.1 LysR family transcriptional regulator [Aminobacter sp. NyZ550]